MTPTVWCEELEIPTREEALENQFYLYRRDHERQRLKLTRLQPDINHIGAALSGGIAAGSALSWLLFGLPFELLAPVVSCVEGGVLGLWGMLTVYLR